MRSAFDLGLLYSQSWEDLECARAALRVEPGDVVLTIAAAGDNSLGLLLDDPARVIAVDVNPAQLFLGELKAAAVCRLGPAERLGFLGVSLDDGRLDAYQRLRGAISAPAAQFWDARPGAIREGIIHAGRFERYLGLFRRRVLRVVPGRAVIDEMLRATDVEEQRRVYAESWNSWRWNLLLRLFFSRPMLAAFGRHRSFFRHASVAEVGQHYLDRVRIGLTATPISKNHYLNYMLTGTYRLPDGLPAYLQPESTPTIADRIDRLEFTHGSLTDIVRGLPASSVDAFYLSDVFELMSPGEYAEALAEIIRVARSGARLCYWNNLVERHCPDALSSALASEHALAAQLHERDRAFIYSRFVVETVVGATKAADV